jgi:hypothetical protein
MYRPTDALARAMRGLDTDESGKKFVDGEVLGLCEKGLVVQWDAFPERGGKPGPFNSGETLEQFSPNIRCLEKHEIRRVLPVSVTDMSKLSITNRKGRVVNRFRTVREANDWIAGRKGAERAKVSAGLYSINAPEDMT